jgi:hypothetical protein
MQRLEQHRFQFPVIFALSFVAASGAQAEVNFGKNVYIGGHDFSNQHFDKKHRAKVYLYNQTPKHAGCYWRADGRGGHEKICHLRKL